MPNIYEDGNYLTDKGRALIAKCLAAQTAMEFTRAAIGSGSIPAGETPQSMTDLTQWQTDGLISDISTPVSGEAQIDFQVFSQNISTGFFASEGGVWATDPDEGEILYTYIVIANHPEWIRASNDPVLKFAEFTCISIVDAVQVDCAQVNPEAIVTYLQLQKYITLSGDDVPVSGTKMHLKIARDVTGAYIVPDFDTDPTLP
jgi:hypothetical protein